MTQNVTVTTKRLLGIDFFDGSAEAAAAYASDHGGLVVAPAAPSLVALQYDVDYRHAIAEADLALADSGWMVLIWRMLTGEGISRISGLNYFKRLLDLPESRVPRQFFWILPSEASKRRTLAWLRDSGFPVNAEDCYVAPRYKTPVEDEMVLATIRQRQPKHIIVGIGGGTQDKIGRYLKHHCGYRPAIHCIGAAPGFVTGDQVMIPDWADRFFLGWIFRLVAQPHIFFPRFWSVRKLPGLIIRYRRELPPLIAA